MNLSTKQMYNTYSKIWRKKPTLFPTRQCLLYSNLNFNFNSVLFGLTLNSYFILSLLSILHLK